jgi:hypothetical protein
MLIDAEPYPIALYEECNISYAAQLYAYEQLAPDAVIEARKKIIQEACEYFFFTTEFADCVAEFIQENSHTVPTSVLCQYTLSVCGSFNVCNQHLASRGDYRFWPDFYNKKGKNHKKLAMEERDRRLLMILAYICQLAGGDIENSDPELNDISIFVNEITMFISSEDLNHFMDFTLKYRDKYKKFGGLVLSTVDILQKKNWELEYHARWEFFRLWCKDSSDPCETLKLKAKKTIEQRYKDAYQPVIASALAGLKSGFLVGPYVNSINTLFKQLEIEQKSENLKYLSLFLDFVSQTGLTASRLYDRLKAREAEPEKQLDNEDNDIDNPAVQASGKDTDSDMDLALSVEADARIENALEETARRKAGVVSETEEKNDDNKIDNADDGRGQKIDEVIISPIVSTETTTLVARPKKPGIPKRVRKDQKNKPRPVSEKKSTLRQEIFDTLLASVGTLRNIQYRIDELKGSLAQLNSLLQKAESKTDTNVDFEALAEVGAKHLQELEKAALETEWKKSVLFPFINVCDKVQIDISNAIRRLQKKTEFVRSFDEALWETIKNEALVTGKTHGKVIPKITAGKNQLLIDLYHGQKFYPAKKITINGVKRKLRSDEILVLYVTYTSTTPGIRYCISVKLWKIREVGDPGPSYRSRLDFPGTLRPENKIDPELWKCTGKTCAVLHVA